MHNKGNCARRARACVSPYCRGTVAPYEGPEDCYLPRGFAGMLATCNVRRGVPFSLDQLPTSAYRIDRLPAPSFDTTYLQTANQETRVIGRDGEIEG